MQPFHKTIHLKKQTPHEPKSLLYKTYQITLTSAYPQTLRLYTRFLTNYFHKINLHYTQIHLSTHFKKITLLKSPHVNKNAQEHFELRQNKITFFLKHTPNLFFLFINKPKTVHLHIQYTQGRIV